MSFIPNVLFLSLKRHFLSMRIESVFPNELFILISLYCLFPQRSISLSSEAMKELLAVVLVHTIVLFVSFGALEKDGASIPPR